jgi:hypothetical protein
MTNSTPTSASSQDSRRGSGTPESAEKARRDSQGNSGECVPGTITDVGPKPVTGSGGQ